MRGQIHFYSLNLPGSNWVRSGVNYQSLSLPLLLLVKEGRRQPMTPMNSRMPKNGFFKIKAVVLDFLVGWGLFSPGLTGANVSSCFGYCGCGVRPAGLLHHLKLGKGRFSESNKCAVF
jgi:hypothetical protein